MHFRGNVSLEYARVFGCSVQLALGKAGTSLVTVSVPEKVVY